MTVNEVMNKISVALKFGFSWSARDLDILLIMDSLFDGEAPPDGIALRDDQIIEGVSAHATRLLAPGVDPETLLLDQRKRHMRSVLAAFGAMTAETRNARPQLEPTLCGLKREYVS